MSHELGTRNRVCKDMCVVGGRHMMCNISSGALVIPGDRATSSEMTPYDYMNLYRNLEIPYVRNECNQVSHTIADVHIYVNNSIAKRKSNRVEKIALQRIVRKEARKVQTSKSVNIAVDKQLHNQAIAHAYFGKGHPWEYRVYLSYALTFSRTLPYALKDYCDLTASLGIDCSGFVNSFLVSTGKITKPKSINSFGKNKYRKNKKEIAILDLLIWQGTAITASRHIAIVNKIIDSDKLHIIESSGSKGGLSSSIYTIKFVKNSIFTVDRGINKNGQLSKLSKVKIFSYS